ncbi:hypothetical protein D3C75_686000 [compost metagenome]
MDQAAVRTFDQLIVGGALQRVQRLVHLRNILLGNIVGVRPRIGYNLVLLIERLGDIQCFFSGESVLPVRLTLQQSQIIQLVRILLRILNLIGGDPAGFSLDLKGQRVSLLLVGQAVPLPHAFIDNLILGKMTLHLKKLQRRKRLNRFLPVIDQRQHRRLHPSN